MKRVYIQPAARVVLMIQPMHLCDGSIDTERIGPDGPIGDGDEAPTREFDWDYEDDEE